MLAWAQSISVVCALVAVWYDFRHRRVPNVLVVLTAVLAVALLAGGQPIWPGLTWSAAMLAALLGLVIFVWLYVRGLMGAGDVKFFAVAGLLVGPWGLCFVWLVSSLLGGLHAIVIWMRGRSGEAARGIPYAAYMAIGIVLLVWLRSSIEAARNVPPLA